MEAKTPLATAEPEQTTTSRIDLNSDLGESLGTWQLGDDAAMLDLVTSANVACGFHAGDSPPCSGCAPGGRARRRHRRPGRLPRPRRVRPALHRHGPGRADRRRHLPGRRPRRDWPRWPAARVAYVKPHGALYNAIVQHEEQAEAVVRAVMAIRPGAAGHGAARLGVPAPGARRPGCAPWPRRSPTVPTRRRVRWCRAVSPVPSSMTRVRWPSAWCGS